RQGTRLRHYASRMRPSVLRRYFAASDALLQRVEPTWWGAVVSDDRFPDVYDLNYARVDAAHPDLSLDDVLGDLVPAMVRAGAGRARSRGSAPCSSPAGSATSTTWSRSGRTAARASPRPSFAGWCARQARRAPTRPS